MPNILLICKDSKLYHALSPLFNIQNYDLTLISNPESTIDSIWGKKPMAILINSQISKLSLFNLVGILKKSEHTQKIPIIVLGGSESNIAEKELKSLKKGVDDFIKQPCMPETILIKTLRIISNIEKENGVEEILESGKIILDMSSHKAYVNNKELPLTPKEFALLYLFIKSRNKVLNRLFLSETIWEQKYLNTSHTIDRHIANLRKKLGKEGERIQTIPTIGYRFIEQQD
ncbi:winged-helix domain-containing protein [bacterium]